MKLLVDANLSPRVVAILRNAGHDARHVTDVGLGTASDAEIVAWAANHRNRRPDRAPRRTRAPVEGVGPARPARGH